MQSSLSPQTQTPSSHVGLHSLFGTARKGAGPLPPAWRLFSPQLSALGFYPCRSGPVLTYHCGAVPCRAVPAGRAPAEAAPCWPLRAPGASLSSSPAPSDLICSQCLAKTSQSECIPSVGWGWWLLFDCLLGVLLLSCSQIVPEGWFCPLLCFIIWGESHVKHRILILYVKCEYPSRELRSVKYLLLSVLLHPPQLSHIRTEEWCGCAACRGASLVQEGSAGIRNCRAASALCEHRVRNYGSLCLLLSNRTTLRSSLFLYKLNVFSFKTNVLRICSALGADSIHCFQIVINLLQIMYCRVIFSVIFTCVFCSSTVMWIDIIGIDSKFFVAEVCV